MTTFLPDVRLSSLSEDLKKQKTMKLNTIKQVKRKE